MKKRLFITLLAILCLILPACSQSAPAKAPAATPSPAPVPQISPPPEGEIAFLDIPWGLDDETVIALVRNRFPDINSVEEEKTPNGSYVSPRTFSFGFSDPLEKCFPICRSDAVKTKRVFLRNIQEYPHGVKYSADLGTVAGYQIHGIDLCFIEDGVYRFYSATYYFSDSKEFSVEFQYSDLQQKMTRLYGEPLVYTYESSNVTETSDKCAVWQGLNGTGAYLHYTHYLSGYLDGSESVTLVYGTSAVNDLFLAAEAEQAARQQEAIEDISKDDSGL